MIVFNDIIFSIIDYIRTDSNLTISSIENYDNKKLAVALDLPNKSALMIEILPNGVCDLFVIDDKLDEYPFFNSSAFESVEELESHVFKFISDFKDYPNLARL